MESFLPFLIIAGIVLVIVIAKKSSGSSSARLDKSNSPLFGATADHFLKSKQEVVNEPEITLTVEYDSGRDPKIKVSKTELESAVRAFEFVVDCETELSNLENSWLANKSTDWLAKTVSEELVLRPEIESLARRGPDNAEKIVKETRKLIREKRKNLEDFQELLDAMYKVSVLADFLASLKVLGNHSAERIARFVDLHEISDTPIRYEDIGLEYLDLPLKTDRKWYLEKFGEPKQHLPAVEIFSEIRKKAIARYCWDSLINENNPRSSLGMEPMTIREWLDEVVESELYYHKEWLHRVQKNKSRKQESKQNADRALAATNSTFVVADLETTGLDSNQHEITEIGALKVNAQGRIESEFSTLVKTQSKIPNHITDLTGIDDQLVSTEGRELIDALQSFLSFTKGQPIFFHNAPFDEGFLKRSCEAHGLSLENDFHDTLPMARQAWPTLGRYNLKSLAEFLEIDRPSHRALSDAKTTLSVLLASRNSLKIE